MFEVPFSCKCEACGAQMTGIIKRGPLIIFPLLAMLVWAIAFFDAFIPFLICMAIGVGLGIFLPLRSHLKHREGDKREYEKALKEYKAYQDGLSKIKAESAPELDWSQARFVPVK